MPKVDLDAITPSNATGYPDPFHKEVQGRWWKRIAPAAGLTELGASHAVADHGVADLLGDGEADAQHLIAVAALADEQDEAGCRDSGTAIGGQEI